MEGPRVLPGIHGEESAISILVILELVGIGVAGGFLAGSLGFGGAIVNPLVWVVFGQLGLPASVVVQASFATALARMPLSALMAGISHARMGNVEWGLLVPLVLAGIVGSLAGSTAATFLSGDSLKTVFALFQIYVAWSIARRRAVPVATDEASRSRNLAIIIGAVTGFTASFLGIGGGVVAVPLFIILLRFPMPKAIGTSCALMVLNTATGTAGYIYHGWGQPRMPAFSLGYVVLWPALALTVSSVVAAAYGASFASRINQNTLRWIFVVLLVASAVRILAF